MRSSSLVNHSRLEEFVAESAVETLDEPVLHRPTGADEAELHTRFYCPHLHGEAGELVTFIYGDVPPDGETPAIEMRRI